ncbi:TRAP transporter large permease subunit, partial [Roseovarius mucosus]|uniref:TRAP transporter large permease subunit n=1 Tax=Roseovarius mucosus TaxID=215743 RepID=UPI003F71116C
MDPIFASVVLLGIFFALLVGGLWIGMALAAVGYVALEFFTGRPPGLLFGTAMWQSSNSWTLTALPLFIWMGEILFRSRLAEDMFKGIAPWVQALPGRLLHTNVFGC